MSTEYFTNHLFHPNLEYKRDGLTPLVAATVVRNFAIHMVALFSSTYIYQTSIDLGYSATNSILFICLFYFILATTKFFFLIVGENYSQKYGYKHTMWLSIIPFFVFIPLIILGGSFFPALMISAVFWGAHAGYFWWGYHGYFVKAKKDKKYGEGIGSVDLIYTLVAIVAPIIGALIIAEVSYLAMYVVSLLLVILSIFVLGKDFDKSPKHNVRVIDVIKDAITKPLTFAAYASRGMSFEAYSSFWSVYLFLLFGTVIDLGLIVSISTLLTSFIMIFVGKYVDKHGERKAIIFSSPLLSVAWILRFLARSITPIIGANILASVGGRAVHLSMDEIAYKKANYGHTSHALLFREMGLVFGQLIVIFMVAVFTILFNHFSYIFLLVAISSLIPLIFAFKNLHDR